MLYTGSKFRLSMPYFSVGIMPNKHSITHPLQGLGDFQGGVIIVLSMHTPTEYHCLGSVQAQKAICTCVTLWGIDLHYERFDVCFLECSYINSCVVCCNMCLCLV